jgi:hypothetical protein
MHPRYCRRKGSCTGTLMQALGLFITIERQKRRLLPYACRVLFRLKQTAAS